MRIRANYYIYALVDPRDDSTRYVGITINKDLRLGNHINDVGVNDAKERWIADLKRLGLVPSMRVLEQSTDSEYAYERELYWIQTLLAQGVPLTNMRIGRQKVLHHLQKDVPSLVKPLYSRLRNTKRIIHMKNG